MHYSLLVIGDDPEGMLEPYNEELHQPIWTEGEAEELVEILASYGTEATEHDLQEYAAWAGYAGCRIHDGRLEIASTYNDQGRWDWWIAGGRWSGILRDADGKGSDISTVGAVRWDQQLADVTSAMLVNGTWYDLHDGGPDAALELMLDVISTLPKHTPVLVADCHH